MSNISVALLKIVLDPQTYCFLGVCTNYQGEISSLSMFLRSSGLRHEKPSHMRRQKSKAQILKGAEVEVLVQ